MFLPAHPAPPPAEVAAASSVLTLEQMRQQLAQLEEQKAAQEAKLAGLRGGGARRVSAADMAAVEKVGWLVVAWRARPGLPASLQHADICA